MSAVAHDPLCSHSTLKHKHYCDLLDEGERCPFCDCLRFAEVRADEREKVDLARWAGVVAYGLEQYEQGQRDEREACYLAVEDLGAKRDSLESPNYWRAVLDATAAIRARGGAE